MKSNAAKRTAREVRSDGFAGSPGMSLGMMTVGGIEKGKALKYEKKIEKLNRTKDSLINVIIKIQKRDKINNE